MASRSIAPAGWVMRGRRLPRVLMVEFRREGKVRAVRMQGAVRCQRGKE